MTDINNNNAEGSTTEIDLLLNKLEHQLSQGKLTFFNVNDENTTLLHVVIKELDPLSDIDGFIRERIKKAIDTALQNQIDINVIDSNGRTILHTAATNTSLNLFNFLWEKMANPTIKDNDENSPTTLAIASIKDRIYLCSATLQENKSTLSNIFDKVDSQDFQNSLGKYYYFYTQTLLHIVLLERDLKIITQYSNANDQYDLCVQLTGLIDFSHKLIAGHLNFTKNLSSLLAFELTDLEAHIREEKCILFFNSLAAIQPLLEALEVFPLKNISVVSELRENFTELESIKLNFAKDYFNFIVTNLFTCGLLPLTIKRKDEEICEQRPDQTKRCRFH